MFRPQSAARTTRRLALVLRETPRRTEDLISRPRVTTVGHTSYLLETGSRAVSNSLGVPMRARGTVGWRGRGVQGHGDLRKNGAQLDHSPWLFSRTFKAPWFLHAKAGHFLAPGFELHRGEAFFVSRQESEPQTATPSVRTPNPAQEGAPARPETFALLPLPILSPRAAAGTAHTTVFLARRRFAGRGLAKSRSETRTAHPAGDHASGK